MLNGREVTISTIVEENEYVLTVADTATGIKKKIFQRFLLSFLPLEKSSKELFFTSRFPLQKENFNMLTAVLLFFVGVAFGICILMPKRVSLLKDNAAKEQKIKDLMENIAKQTQLNDILKTEFENIAAKVLEEKSSKIANLNKDSLENVIGPFKMKIDEFKNKVETLQLYEAEKMSGLQKELEKLIDLNKQVSQEANNLAGALKGNNKLQGTWGELNIDRIFEYAGLVEGVNYMSQKRFKDEQGEKIPDYVVILPDKKHIVIDAKTSLTAYEKYYNAQDEREKRLYLKEHCVSVKKHIDELNLKDYANLPELDQAEYTLMFVPVEAAVSAVFLDKPDIISYAFKKNIVIVTPPTLLATLKTIEYIWRQEHQKRNVLEIAKQGSILYDKFATFVRSLVEVDKKISEAKNKMQETIKRLSSSDKKGDSLIERAQKLKELGAYVKKELPKEVLDATEERK